MIKNPVCIMCGSSKGTMPVKFMGKPAMMCPKCYYAGVPALAPRYNPTRTAHHHLSFCTTFQKPFLTPKISAERGTVKCPYCGQWHRIGSEASPNPTGLQPYRDVMISRIIRNAQKLKNMDRLPEWREYLLNKEELEKLTNRKLDAIDRDLSMMLFRYEPNPKYPKWESQTCKFCGAKTHTQYEMRICPVCRKEQATGKVIPLTRARNPKTYRTVATFHSKSDPKKFYTVKLDERGQLSCNCPSWVFKKGAVRGCPHVEAVKAARNPIRHTTQGWYWGGRGPFPTREKAVEVQRAAYAAGYKGRNPKISRPRGIEDGLIKAETEEQIKKLVLKFRATPPLERKKLLRDLVLRARTHDDVDIIRQAVRRANLFLELQEVQKEIETERARRRLGYRNILAASRPEEVERLVSKIRGVGLPAMRRQMHLGWTDSQLAGWAMREGFIPTTTPSDVALEVIRRLRY